MPGAASGPEPQLIRDATRILLIGLERGSARLVLEVPEPASSGGEGDRLFEPPPPDLGFRALEGFVEGIHELETASTRTTPSGWDASLMVVAKDLADLAQERNYEISLDAEPPGGERRSARITPSTAERFAVQQSPVRRRRTAVGRLILVDLGRGRIDIEDAAGHRTQAHFRDELEAAVRPLLGEFVRATGEEEVDEATGHRGKLEIEAVAPVGEQTPLEGDFWSNRPATELSTDQGAAPIISIEDFSAPDVFSDEDVERFLEAIRDSRSDG